MKSATACYDVQLVIGGAVPGIDLCPPNCFGFKIRRLHHCSKTHQALIYNWRTPLGHDFNTGRYDHEVICMFS